jgi:hypothetical protein
MEIVGNSGNRRIAGAKIGDCINILMLHGKTETIILSDIDRNGIEGFQVQLKGQPAAFYPFAGILKVTKFEEVK